MTVALVAARIEMRRLSRSGLLIGLVLVFAFFGLSGPVLAAHLPEMLRAAVGTEQLTISASRATPEDGIALFTQSAMQLGLVFAVATAVTSRTVNNGQACINAKRFIVHADIYDAFLEKFTAKMTEAKVGDPFAEDTVLGPLSSLTAAERLAEQVDKAVAQGATLVAGGKRDGAFYPGTVLTDVTPEMDAYGEEFFGPVGIVFKVADEDEAVKIANDTSFGLGSYVFTTDEDQAARVADKIDAGMVYVNVVLADEPGLPFGGVKRSGTSREMGLLAADEFVNKKLIRIGA